MSKYWRGAVCAVTLVAALAIFVNSATAETPTAGVSKEVEAALLAGDWSKVLADLPTGEALAASPVARLIRGHACLATNKSNESLEMLVTSSGQEDLKQWDAWTKTLAEGNPGSAVARYLRGDALARQSRFTDAAACLSEALRLEPGNVLVRNARAVVYAARQEWDAARDDFSVAAAGSSQLADLYSSRGAYILQRQTDPQKALEYYEQALQISPDSSLALNGRACARILMHQWDTALADLEAAGKQPVGAAPQVARVLAANLACAASERKKAVDGILMQVAGIKPGMSIDETMQKINALPLSQRQTALDVANNAAGFNKGVLQNPYVPDKVDLGVTAGMNAIGPYAEGSASATVFSKDATRQNFNDQSLLRDRIMQDNPGLKPREIGNLDAFVLQHDDAFIYGQFTKPGGVSTSEIGAEPVDAGSWNVTAMYGLAYGFEEALAASPVERVAACGKGESR